MLGEQHEPLSTRKSLETKAQKRTGRMGVSLVRRDQRQAHVQETQPWPVKNLPLRGDAEQAVSDLRANINVEVRVPITGSDLIAHYRKHELTDDKRHLPQSRQRRFIDKPNRAEEGRYGFRMFGP